MRQGFYCAFGMGSQAFSFSFTIVISIYILVQTIYNISITYYCQSLMSVVASINTSAFMICSTRAAHHPSDGYGRTTNGRVTGTGSPSTICPVVSAKSQWVRTGMGTAVVWGTVVDGRPLV